MGVYRLALSVFVVAYHFGNVTPNAVRVAVYAFFCLSGALMALVLDRVYGADLPGTLRFYTNRLLRLGPIILLYAGLTYAVGLARPDATRAILPMGLDHVLVQGDVRGWPPTVRALPAFSPQLWSLVNEGMFYVLAPAFVRLWRTRRAAYALLATASGALTVFMVLSGRAHEGDGYGFDLFVYQNFFANLWIFMLGMALYFVRDRARHRVARRGWAAALFATLLVVFTHVWRLNPHHYGPTHPVSHALVLALYAMFVPAALLTWTLVGIDSWPGWFGRIERLSGNVAYGVFVNQFLAAIVVVEIGRWTGSAALTTVHQPRFAVATVVLAIVMSAITYVVVEIPVQRLRRRVRGGEARTRLVSLEFALDARSPANTTGIASASATNAKK